MTRYVMELRNAWGRTVWAVLDTETNLRTVARCDTREDATLVMVALNQTARVS